jgi:GrpB-like predicted nucleotidyltransferase (UPF0157 family)
VSEAVALRPYDPEWAGSFAAEYPILQACFEQPPLAVEHIGSTSVPGLSSKPIVDILVHVADRARGEAAIPALEAAGYANVPNYIDPNRLVLIKRRADGQRSHHVHVHFDADEVRRHLMFRDRLRADAAVRDAYAALKAGLADRFADDRAAYSKHKTAFVDDIVLGMGGPARKTPWNP